MPQLADLIAAYPPYVPPVVKPHGEISQQEAEANLADLVNVRPARIRAFGAWLAGFGIDLEAGMAAPSPGPLLDELWRWTVDQWPSIYDHALAAHGARRTPLGRSPVFGLLTDLALVLGEMVIDQGAGYRWSLDVDPGNRTMASFRQPCVIGASEAGAVTVFDALGLADGAYANCQKGGYRFANDLKRVVTDRIGDASRGREPSRQRVSTLYDKASDHLGEGGEATDGDSPEDDWGATHLALFVAWLARHDLLSTALSRHAAALKAGRVRPLDWLMAECDGALTEADLTAEGNRFVRHYFGTPAGGLHAGKDSYLADFIDTLKGGDDTIEVEDSWTNYDRLAPVIDRRHAAFKT